MTMKGQAMTVQSISSPDELLELEADAYREYWGLLRSGLPLDWLADERAALVAKLEQLRDSEAAAMLAAEQQGDLVEHTERRERYEALALALPEKGTP
jgi:hypothetical protein